MEAVAHDPKFARKVGIPQSVGKDYAAADAGRSFVAGRSKTPMLKRGPGRPRGR